MPSRHSTTPAILALLAAGALLFWRGLDSGPIQAPELAKPSGRPCLEEASAMRARHMRLLHDWRDKAVREGQRIHTAPDGSKWRISLQGTCLSCHEKTSFCSPCHEKNAVEPSCWSCHARNETAGPKAAPDSGGKQDPQPKGGRP
ncbi:MAG: sulfate reduction electron transfer complex DsrMKJOP subunit DsrJ [Desulfovibrionaceae bacterium]|nr:sulfate reduction electron transfer complex DsrMKJOP subunit DsrJ [Desulfovibrionaceae bacterium]